MWKNKISMMAIMKTKNNTDKALIETESIQLVTLPVCDTQYIF